MEKPLSYAKRVIRSGTHPMMVIEPGAYGTFWLHDADYRMLDCKAFASKEAAETFRSKIIEKAVRLAA